MLYSGTPTRRAFSLLEIMVAMVVLLIVMGVVLFITDKTGELWQNTSGKIGAFQEARIAFESLTRKISQATLNTYYDYDSPTDPANYLRQSELHFVCDVTRSLIPAGESVVPAATNTWTGKANAVRPGCGIFFQAPLGYSESPANVGLDKLLNACGYYVEFNDDSLARPLFLSGAANAFPLKYRYRLMELRQPAESLWIYRPDFVPAAVNPDAAKYNGWFKQVIADGQVRPLAENIVTLIFEPRTALGDGAISPFSSKVRYDSRDPSNNATKNQLPPLIQATLIAIDDSSAIRLAAKYGIEAPKLTTSDDPNQPNYLATIERELAEKRIRFRIFTTGIIIRGAKWSND